MLIRLADTINQLKQIEEMKQRAFIDEVQTPLNNILKQEMIAAQSLKKKQETKSKQNNKNDPILKEISSEIFGCKEKCEQVMLQSTCSMFEQQYNQIELESKLYRRILPELIKYRTLAEIKALKEEGTKYQVGSRMEVPENQILKKGQLEKKGAIRRNWTSRWFILKSRYLFYFNNKNDLLLKGFIRLENCSVQISSNKKKPNCLAICTALRTFFISTPTENDCNEWLHAIKNATVEEEIKRLEETHKLQLESLSHSQAQEYLERFLRDDESKQVDEISNNNSSKSPEKTENEPKNVEKKEEIDNLSSSSKRREELLAQVSDEPKKRRKKKKDGKSSRKKNVVDGDQVKDGNTPSRKKKKKKKESNNNLVDSNNDINSPDESSDGLADSNDSVIRNFDQTINDLPTAPTPDIDENVDTNEDVLNEIKPEEQNNTDGDHQEVIQGDNGDDNDDNDVYDESDDEYEDDGLETLGKTLPGRSRASTALALLNASISHDNDDQKDQIEQVNNEEMAKEEKTGESEEICHDESKEQSESIINNEILYKQGYLMKKGAKRRNWTTRWFILSYNRLSYYKNPGVCFFCFKIVFF